MRTSARFRVSAASFLGALLVVSGTAWAEPSRAEIAVARRLFTEAAALREAGQWADAAGRLREAISIKETPGLRFHLAHCETQLGHLVAARAEYERARDLIRAGAKAPDVVTLLAPAVAALDERIPTWTVRVPAGARDVRGSMDGHELAPAELGQPLLLDPGEHILTVDAADREPFTLEVRIEEGERRVTEAAGPVRRVAPSPVPVPPVARMPRGRPGELGSSAQSGIGAREILLLSEGALTLASLGLGVDYVVRDGAAARRTARDQSQIDAQLPAYAEEHAACSVAGPGLPACADLSAALVERGKDRIYALTAFTSAGIGGAALVATFLLWPTRSPGATPHARLYPAPGGAMVRGTF